MDYFVIAITTAAGLYFHWWIYWRIRHWMDRDLALALAGSDPAKRDYMLQQLEQARQLKIPRKALPAWLEDAAGKNTNTP